MVKKKQLSRREIIKVILFITLATIVIFATVAFLVTRGSHAPAAGDYTAQGDVNLNGLAVCLPHKNPSEESETLECHVGIRNSKGTYYSLADTSSENLNVGKILPGKEYEISGKLEERGDEKFQTAGIVRVEKIKEL